METKKLTRETARYSEMVSSEIQNLGKHIEASAAESMRRADLHADRAAQQRYSAWVDSSEVGYTLHYKYSPLLRNQIAAIREADRLWEKGIYSAIADAMSEFPDEDRRIFKGGKKYQKSSIDLQREFDPPEMEGLPPRKFRTKLLFVFILACCTTIACMIGAHTADRPTAEEVLEGFSWGSPLAQEQYTNPTERSPEIQQEIEDKIERKYKSNREDKIMASLPIGLPVGTVLAGLVIAIRHSWRKYGVVKRNTVLEEQWLNANAAVRAHNAAEIDTLDKRNADYAEQLYKELSRKLGFDPGDDSILKKWCINYRKVMKNADERENFVDHAYLTNPREDRWPSPMKMPEIRQWGNNSMLKPLADDLRSHLETQPIWAK